MDPKNQDDSTEDGNIKLSDCFKAFRELETLDEDNMWYCNKCREHVQATKVLEIFRVPRILIISLKRFKQAKSKYSWGGGKKIDTLVDFPLEGLDMSPFVLSESQKSKQKLIYDCYAVSNHYGGVGGGHYTAFGKNPMDGKWYDFDDSHVSPVEGGYSRKEIVSTGAYNLFYRLRDHVDDILNVDYQQIS